MKRNIIKQLIVKSVKLLQQSLALASVSLLLMTSAAKAQGEFPDGAKILFAGHSLLIPTANAFDEIADDAGFVDHEADFVFRPGPAGSPQNLWNDEEARAEVQSFLVQGDYDLFVLSVYPGRDDPYYYEEWIKFALEQNPDTKILIAAPWWRSNTGHAGLFETPEDLEAANVVGAVKALEVVTNLRETFAGETEIFYINYAKMAVNIWREFLAGNLPSTEFLYADEACEFYALQNGTDPTTSCRTKKAVRSFGDQVVFLDRLPHAASVLTHASAVLWIYYLYDKFSAESFIDTDYGYLALYGSGTDVIRETRRDFKPRRSADQ